MNCFNTALTMQNIEGSTRRLPGPADFSGCYHRHALIGIYSANTASRTWKTHIMESQDNTPSLSMYASKFLAATGILFTLMQSKANSANATPSIKA
jgi:hypothetical protein